MVDANRTMCDVCNVSMDDKIHRLRIMWDQYALHVHASEKCTWYQAKARTSPPPNSPSDTPHDLEEGDAQGRYAGEEGEDL